MKLSEIRLRRGCQAIDPRDGRERERLVAGDDLEMTLDGHLVILTTGDKTVVLPFSNISGATLVAVPAAKPVNRKGEVEK